MYNDNCSANDAQDFDRTVKKEEKENIQKTVLDYLHDLVGLIAVIMLVFSLLFRVVIVDGPSMNDTLVHGDWLLLLGNFLYGDPEAGDIIVASKDAFENGEPIIKRVIATEGQKVDIDFFNGVVYVDDIPLDEPYTLTPTNLQEGMSFPLIVDDDCVFVMGDNRNKSKDSRSTEIGLIDNREILGRAVFLFFPGKDRDHPDREFDRIGLLH